MKTTPDKIWRVFWGSCHHSLFSCKTHNRGAFTGHSFKQVRITTVHPKRLCSIGSIPDDCSKHADSSAWLQLVVRLRSLADLHHWIDLVNTRALIQAEIISNCNTGKQTCMCKYKSDTYIFKELSQLFLSLFMLGYFWYIQNNRAQSYYCKKTM